MIPEFCLWLRKRFHSGMSRTCGSASLFMLSTELPEDH